MDDKEQKYAIKRLREVARNNSNYRQNPFFARWLNVFVGNLTETQYRKHIHKQYIWHAFSSNIVSKEKFLEGDAARQAYNNANKDGAIALQLDFEDTPSTLTEEFDTAEKLENVDGYYAEFYVVGKNFSWTYIVTHETDIGLGPYFMEIKN